MSIRSMLRHTCSTARMQAAAGRVKQMTALYSSLPCMFTPMSAYAAISQQFEVGSAWDVLFEDGTDIKKGDRLTFNGGNYIVKGVQPFGGYGSVSYLKVSAVTENA